MGQEGQELRTLQGNAQWEAADVKPFISEKGQERLTYVSTYLAHCMRKSHDPAHENVQIPRKAD